MASTGNQQLFNTAAGIQKKNACIVLVKTEWNSNIVDELELGCIQTLQDHGIAYKVLTVPGCVEIPFAIKRNWNNTDEFERPDAYIAFGCVIQGDTPHFDYVCKMVADGITHLNMTLPIPTIFGVLTVNTEQQALERIGGIHGHKGVEAAITALKML
ncbi:MAG: 6,7-dimethyl-8-ribityllumazine synthase [Chitinophagaceae bacterium]|nr:MAG: 6,7-dimethyl-8-ribityllumazine synthase [Chitinophagaceae bacterium]